MRGHQKYFAVESATGRSRRISWRSLICRAIRRLDSRRARARAAGAICGCAVLLGDGSEMSARRLSAETRRRHLPGRLGSYGDKVERMRALARWLAEQWFASGIPQASVGAADRAAELAKCDLVTDMVREFTELQGIVGGLYAKAQGEPEEVAWAVYDQYKPAGLDDPIPRNLTGQALALADKMDSLVGCFAVGLIPSGSSDPFALRRAALGSLRSWLRTKLPVSLSRISRGGKIAGAFAQN